MSTGNRSKKAVDRDNTGNLESWSDMNMNYDYDLCELT